MEVLIKLINYNLVKKIEISKNIFKSKMKQVNYE